MRFLHKKQCNVWFTVLFSDDYLDGFGQRPVQDPCWPRNSPHRDGNSRSASYDKGNNGCCNICTVKVHNVHGVRRQLKSSTLSRWLAGLRELVAWLFGAVTLCLRSAERHR